MLNAKQRLLIKRSFVETACRIADADGYEAITARCLAREAGYNIATVYNYFQDLDHLLFYVNLRALKPYASAIGTWTKGISDPILLYMETWKCFNTFAFASPREYFNIFCMPISKNLNSLLQSYYEMFPEELPFDGLKSYPMLSNVGLYQKDYFALNAAAQLGDIRSEDLTNIANNNFYIFSGSLKNFMNDGNCIPPRSAARKATASQAHTLIGYGVNPEKLRVYL